MFPVSIAVATVAMASGVEGATFFAPIFLLGLGLPPEVAIGTGLITEVFGFASGVFAYVRKKLIDYRLAGVLLMVTVPAGIFGSWVSARVPGPMLKAILGLGLMGVAVTFLRVKHDPETVAAVDRAIADEARVVGAATLIRAADGQEFRYTVCNRGEGAFISGVGALFMGMISTGLGEMNGYFLLQRCRVPSPVAVATGVLVVAVTALAAASGHLVRFVDVGGPTLDTVTQIVVFTVPGVILGGQLGPLVAQRMPQKTLEIVLGVMFISVGLLLIATVLL